MKKRLASILLALVMILSLLPTAAFAAGSDYEIDIVATKFSTVQYNGKDTMKLDFMLKTNNGAQVRGIQTALLTIDLTKYDVIYNYNGTAYDGTSTICPLGSVGSDTSGTFAYSTYMVTPLQKINGELVGRRDGNTGYISMNANAGANNYSFDASTSLMSILLGLKDGVDWDELTNDSVRLATSSEASSFNATGVVTISGSNSDSYVYLPANGSSDTLTSAPELAPDNSFEFTKAAYSGVAATISNVAKSGDNVVVTASVPAGETAQYGYSTTNNAAAVTNWQDSDTFAMPAVGTYYFFARVKETDVHQAGGVSAGTEFTIYGPISLSYTAPASMTIGTVIEAMEPNVSGGSGGYSYAVTSGSLPAGLTLNGSTGVISGTPTTAGAASPVTVTVTDSESNTKEAVINFPEVEKKTNTVTFTAPVAQFVEGQAVSFTATATNGTATYTYQKDGESDWSNTVPTAVGSYKVKASVAESAEYKACEATYSFTIIAKAVTGITVTAPTKTTYVVGQSLDTTGMAITAEYNDGTSGTVAIGDVQITGFDSSAPADSQTVTVTYRGKSATFNVIIEAKTLQSIAVTTAPTKTSGYKAFDSLDTTGMVVTATYNSGYEIVSGYTVTYANGDSFRAGDTKAIVNFGGKTADVTVSSVAKATLDVSGVSWTGADSVSYDGQAHSVTLTGLPSGLTVTGYTDNEKTYVGNYTAKATLSYDSVNYELSASISDKSWSITAVEQTPTITATASLAKGGNELDLSTLVANAKGDVFFTIASGNAATLSGSVLTSHATNTGDVVITVNINAKDENSDSTAEYKAYSGTITVSVTNKATATLDVSQSGCTYGETLAEPTYSAPAGTSSTVINYNGTVLKDSSTYNSSTKPTEAGTYTVTVKCETATHIYEGTSASFTIAPKNISGMTVTLSDSTKEYSGSAQTVTVSSVGALAASDYDVSGATSGTNVGNYTVTVTGKGNYTGTASATWKITPKAITISGATATNRGYAKDDKSVVISGVTFSGATLTKDTDYTVTGVMDDANAGTGKSVNVTVVLTNSNYSLANATATTTVDIAKASAQTLSDITDSFKYTVTSGEKAIGTAGMPADAGTLEYVKGTESKTGSVTVSSWAVDANGKVTYTLSGGAENDTITLPVTIKSTNYADSVVNVKLTLTAKDGQAALNITSGTTVVYGNTLNLTVSGGSGTGAVTYTVTNGTGEATVSGNVLTATKAGEVTVVATKAGDDDYNEVSSTPVTITISKATPTGTPGYTAITTSGKTLGDAALTVGTITPADGTITWDLGDAQTVSANTAYAWTYTPADTTNYNVLTGTIKPYVVSAGGGSGSVATYAIVVEDSDNGEITASKKSASKGTDITLTVKADEGYELDTLKVLDKNGDKVKVTKKGDKYTFEMPASKVTVEATFAKIEVEPTFDDVAEDAYYFDAVEWAVEEGITSGTSATTFSPNATCTRAQAVTFLWRAAGSPEPKSTEMPFVDVAADAYYYDAVLWAVENGITSGTSATTFSPNNDCTRAQIVTFLWRSEKSPAADSVNPFADVAAEAYYFDAVLWAVENGVTAGTTATTFSPNNNCTRAQIVTFLYRALNK